MVGGVIGAGLMLLRTPKIKTAKELIQQITITEGSVTLRTLSVKFGIILFHGDGDNSVSIHIDKATDKGGITIFGDEQAIELVADETITITASGNGKTPTIEIAYITW